MKGTAHPKKIGLKLDKTTYVADKITVILSLFSVSIRNTIPCS